MVVCLVCISALCTSSFIDPCDVFISSVYETKICTSTNGMSAGFHILKYKSVIGTELSCTVLHIDNVTTRKVK